MRRSTWIVTVLLMLTILLMALPAFAQDATQEPVATDEAAVTAEPTAEITPEVVTATPPATPMVIIITEAPAEPPVEPPAPVETVSTFGAIGWVLFLLTLSALAFVLVTWVRELRKSAAAGDQNSKNLLAFVNAAQNMLPVDQFLMLIDGLDKRAKATPTPGEIDDKALAQVRAYVYEILGREMPPESPVSGPVAG